MDKFKIGDKVICISNEDLPEMCKFVGSILNDNLVHFDNELIMNGFENNHIFEVTNNESYAGILGNSEFFIKGESDKIYT